MNSDFSKPQRQSGVGVVVMFGNALQKSARALFPILIGLIFQIDKIGKLYFWLGLLAILILVAVVAYLRYLNFTYFLDEENEEFVVKEGVVRKSRLAIPLDKIQQVNINQSLLQKIIGVHALEVDTAGSGSKEVSIKAISHGMALALKKRLLEDTHKPAAQEILTDTVDAVAETEHPFIKISLLSLFKTGITSNYVRTFGLLLAFLITAFQHIEDFLRASDIGEDKMDEYINAELILKFITVIVAGTVVLILVLNLSRTILRYFDFKIARQQGSLLLSYGLLNTKNTIIRPNKVQIVTVGRNYFQKKLNIQDIKIRQASNREANNHDHKKTAIEIPGCNNAEKDVLLKLLLEKFPERGVMLKPNIRKILVPTVFFLLLPLSVYFALAYTVLPEALDFILFVPVYALFVCILIYFGFRNSRLFVNQDFIIKQSGAWDIDNDFLVPYKIQTVSVTQYFWQKYSNVGIVSLHTAGGTISFGLANYTRLKQLVNSWLYQVETSDKNWM
jgi:putative membrane protein